MQVQQQPPYTLTNLRELSEQQQQDVMHKWNKLEATVPRMTPAPHTFAWVLYVKDAPVGILTFVPLTMAGLAQGEIGLRVWRPSRTTLEAGRSWLAWLLQDNSQLIGRVLPRNTPVKKLLQSLGFRLCGYDTDKAGQVMEVHVLERGRLVGPKPRKVSALPALIDNSAPQPHTGL